VNFLGLVQQLHTEVGAAGSAPSAVTSQVGESARLVNWVKRADEFIQLKWNNWKFLRTTWTSLNTTTAGVATLAKPTDLKFWDASNECAAFFYTRPGETDKNPIHVIEYDSIKNQILDTTQGEISRVIIMPDNSLMFEPVPDAIYTLSADYYRKPTLLAADGDESDIPDEFHQIIIGRAMILYGNFENAPEMKDQGEEIYIEQLALLENDQLPNQFNSRYRTGGFFQVMSE